MALLQRQGRLRGCAPNNSVLFLHPSEVCSYLSAWGSSGWIPGASRSRWGIFSSALSESEEETGVMLRSPDTCWRLPPPSVLFPGKYLHETS